MRNIPRRYCAPRASTIQQVGGYACVFVMDTDAAVTYGLMLAIAVRGSVSLPQNDIPCPVLPLKKILLTGHKAVILWRHFRRNARRVGFWLRKNTPYASPCASPRKCGRIVPCIPSRRWTYRVAQGRASCPRAPLDRVEGPKLPKGPLAVLLLIGVSGGSR